MNTICKMLLAAVAVAAIPSITGAAEAQENWVKNCQKCHAADGSGSTAIGKKFKVKDYTDPAVQAEMTDEEIVRITKEGSKDAAGKTRMPAYVDKLTEEEIQDLVALIRSFAKK